MEKSSDKIRKVHNTRLRTKNKLNNGNNKNQTRNITVTETLKAKVTTLNTTSNRTGDWQACEDNLYLNNTKDRGENNVTTPDIMMSDNEEDVISQGEEENLKNMIENKKDTKNDKASQNTTEATIANKIDTIEVRMSDTANELDMEEDRTSDTNTDRNLALEDSFTTVIYKKHKTKTQDDNEQYHHKPYNKNRKIRGSFSCKNKA
ncbi:17089_t:CDS:2 [Cetraspora pellucida]|uniref:17089_t:CDS:1 n=1 Tax=Cetraspora pellucida TaxID=1433469 RepID=A0ACA9MNE4_9GLOM|nr:17089_t:CDS:2 [Cetraspora pellucida]